MYTLMLLSTSSIKKFIRNILHNAIVLMKSYDILIDKADVTSEGLPIKGVRFFLYQISFKVCIK